MTNDFKIIKCPKCGYEYTAAEIFLPQYLLGKPNNILRDDKGHIVLVEGDEPCLDEEFECDRCGTVFTTHVDMGFDSSCNAGVEEGVFTLELDDKEKLF